MTITEWDRYRKCPACFAAMGDPCTTSSGALVEGAGYVPNAVTVPRDRPHTRRELRTKYARDEQFGRVIR